MNKKTIVILTVIATVLVIGAGMFLLQYELERNQNFYEAGKLEGKLYTQQTGNIMLVVNGNLTEVTMPDEWKAQIQQYLNQQGGQ